MHIDNCSHSFAELAATILPSYMGKLHIAIQQPWSTSIFSQPGQGVTRVAKTLGRTADFSGCYVLLDKGKPIYVGISRRVIVRLRQHLMGKDHFAASLAYSMAKKHHGSKLGTRKTAMLDYAFGDHFHLAQAYLRSLSVATVEIDNPLELYVFEAYAAMELETAEWNTFRTH
ncbi:GIY-YIG nuclease family protein [Hymenobacter lapidiphilus]|uniref:GIY-YIG nuclease family protein n=1 Tax=Hymenobacter sp. CCM 8763 TaxID=2303334 RepID=UPI000E3510FA|nr:GIY-YIG nuclease family protein [Hymenobacter sp. CCM 8763]RFP67079.1 GIY-YIG nuclease family protein [Hymenobacter sp. CCM 8763]